MKRQQFFLSVYGWTFWFPAFIAGSILSGIFFLLPGLWPVGLAFAILTLAVLAFYRDFPRKIPTGPGLMVAPADGTVTELTPLPHYEPFNGPALRIGIFLSVLSVHVNRVPCDGVVLATEYREGLFLDARHTDSGLKNQSNAILLGDPQTRKPIAQVKQIVGAIARRIIAPVSPGDTFVRGQRFGMIAFGSRTELYVPLSDNWKPAVSVGQYVYAGRTVMLQQS